MRHTNYLSLISRGRKAGLTAYELYGALNAHVTQESGQGHGQSDTNGYVTQYSDNGHCTHRRLDDEVIVSESDVE